MTEDSPEDRIFTSPFKPAWWLSNRHAQTMYPSLPWSGTPKVELESELLELPDGDTTVVDWVVGRPAADAGAPLLIILHGLEALRIPLMRAPCCTPRTVWAGGRPYCISGIAATTAIGCLVATTLVKPMTFVISSKVCGPQATRDQ